MKYSWIFLIYCLLLAVGGCAPRSDPYRAAEQARHNAETLVAAFGSCHNQVAAAASAGVLHRLLTSLPSTWAPPPRPGVMLLASERPIAASPGQGVIALSQGLLLRVHDEAGLAFVLAHELGHQLLGHNASAPTTTIPPDERRALELAADRFGVGLMALAGYDPRAAAQTVASLYAVHPELSGHDDYPPVQERIAALQEAIEASGWQPPGITWTRSFAQAQRALANNRN